MKLNKYLKLGGVLLASLALVGVMNFFQPSLSANPCDGACVTAGPRLLSVDSGDSFLLDTLFSGLLDSSISLDVLDWEAIATSEINLLDFLTQLESDLVLSSPNEALTTQISLIEFVNAATTVADNDGNAVLKLALDDFSQDIITLDEDIVLEDYLQITFPDSSFADIELNVLDLLTGAVQLYNYENVVTTPTPVSVSAAALGLDGVLNGIDLSVQVVEPPVYVCGGVDTEFYTAAVRLKTDLDLVDIDVNLDALEGVLNGLLGVGYNSDLSLTLSQLDMYVDIAKAEGTLTAIDYVAQSLTAEVTPGVVDIYLGSIDDSTFFDRSSSINEAADLEFGNVGSFDAQVQLMGGSVVDTTVGVEIRAYGEGEAPSVETLNFTGAYPETQTATTSAMFIANLGDDLFSNLEVQFDGSLGMLLDPLVNGTILPTITPLVETALKGTVVTAVLEDLVDPLLNFLGVKLGQAVVTVDGISDECELLDADMDGISNANEDLNGNGNLEDDDTDGDGTPNYLDPDDDGDGVPTEDEDIDGNGDPTDDNTDGDANPNYLDTDDDNDGILTEDEDVDGNGNPADDNTDGDANPNYLDTDDDGDGILTKDEDVDGNGDPTDDNTDGDSHPNYLDADDDGDGILTEDEDVDGNGDPTDDNTDGDSNPNYLDADDDGDGVLTENEDLNGNGNLEDDDTDGDGTPNYLDADDAIVGTPSGGSGSSSSGGGGSSGGSGGGGNGGGVEMPEPTGLNPNDFDNVGEYLIAKREYDKEREKMESEGCMETLPSIDLTFADDDQATFGREYVDYLKRTRIKRTGEFVMNGYETDNRSVVEVAGYQNPTLRYEMFKMVLISNCWPILENIDGDFEFADMSRDLDGTPAENYIKRVVYSAYEYGVINGYADAMVRAYQPTSRAEALKVLVRSSGIDDEVDLNDSFEDVDTGAWYAYYIAVAKKLGIVSGYGDNSSLFGPERTTIRSEAAKIVTEGMKHSRHLSSAFKKTVGR
jgi:uncharacterized membrane protein